MFSFRPIIVFPKLDLPGVCGSFDGKAGLPAWERDKHIEALSAKTFF